MQEHRPGLSVRVPNTVVLVPIIHSHITFELPRILAFYTAHDRVLLAHGIDIGHMAVADVSKLTHSLVDLVVYKPRPICCSHDGFFVIIACLSLGAQTIIAPWSKQAVVVRDEEDLNC